MSNTLASGSANTPPPPSDTGNEGGDDTAQDLLQDQAAADAAAQVTPETPADHPQDDDAPSRRNPGERIKEVIAERNATAEWGQYWFNQAMELRKQQGGVDPSAPAPTPGATDPQPTLEQFNFDAAKWSVAHTAWVQREVERRAEAVVVKQLTTREQQQEAETAAASWQTRCNEYRKTNPQFDAIIGNPSLPITKTMTDYIIRSEFGPQVAVHLGTNPAEAARIARLSPEQQKVAIAKIEGRVSVAPPTITRKPTQSRAPAPPNPVRSGGSGEVNLETCSLDEFLEQRLARRKK